MKLERNFKTNYNIVDLVVFYFAGRALGVVVYTGRETRSVMNTSNPSTKIGLLDQEMNNQTKVLFLGTLTLALVMIALKVMFKC